MIATEGSSVVWVSHGTRIMRCAPEFIRPASLREWQSLSREQSDPNAPLPAAARVGANTFEDLSQGHVPPPSDPERATVRPESIRHQSPHSRPDCLLSAVCALMMRNLLLCPTDRRARTEQEMPPQVSAGCTEEALLTLTCEVLDPADSQKDLCQFETLIAGLLKKPCLLPKTDSRL